MPRHNHRPRTAAAVTAVAAAALVLSACGGPATPPPGAPVEALLDPESIPTGPYTGPYDPAFAENLEHYAEQGVTLSAQVETIINPVAFTITTPEDTGEDTADSGTVAPLLIMDFDDPSPTLRPGDRVEITGTVHAAYNVPDIEENLGAPPGPDVLAAYDGRPFLNATSVQTTSPHTATPAP
jgi:hypothetical protein